MLATADAARAGLAGDVVLTAVADEEHASLGSAAVAVAIAADAAIVAEPSEQRVAVAHRGFVHGEIELTGRAAHGSRPELGVDAIARMGRVLTGLEALDRRLRDGAPRPYVGTGSLHASLIEGGQEFSSYPARCAVQVERRTRARRDGRRRPRTSSRASSPRRGRRATTSAARCASCWRASRSRSTPRRRSSASSGATRPPCSAVSRRSPASPTGPTRPCSPRRASRP